MNSAGTRSTPCTRTASSCRSRISWCTLVTTMPSWAAISGTGTNVGVCRHAAQPAIPDDAQLTTAPPSTTHRGRRARRCPPQVTARRRRRRRQTLDAAALSDRRGHRPSAASGSRGRQGVGGADAPASTRKAIALGTEPCGISEPMPESGPVTNRTPARCSPPSQFSLIAYICSGVIPCRRNISWIAGGAFDQVHGRHRDEAADEDPPCNQRCEQLVGHHDALLGQAAAVLDPVDADLERLLDRGQRMRVGGDRKAGAMRPVDQAAAGRPTENCGASTSVPGVRHPAAGHHLDDVDPAVDPLVGPPPAISSRPAHLAAHVVAVPAGAGQRRTGRQDGRLRLAVGRPARCRSRRSSTANRRSPRSRTVVTPAASCRRSPSVITASISSSVYPATRSSAPVAVRRPGARGCRSARAARWRRRSRPPAMRVRPVGPARLDPDDPARRRPAP